MLSVIEPWRVDMENEYGVWKARRLEGYQEHHQYPNGYGASVISNLDSYGGRDGLYEIAVTHGSAICYSTAVTNDVIGYQTNADVSTVLAEIQALPAISGCTHVHLDADHAE
jgi:hypothetical protein